MPSPGASSPYSTFSLFFKIVFIYFEGGGGKERERNIDGQDINQLPLTRPQPRTWPATQARALAGDRELSQRSFALRCDTQFTEPRWSHGYFPSSSGILIPLIPKYL